MAYDPSLTLDRDKIRFLIGDRDDTALLLTDAEIDGALLLEPDLYYCAAECARSIAAAYSRKSDRSMGDLKLTQSQQSKQYLALADSLEARAKQKTGSTAIPLFEPPAGQSPLHDTIFDIAIHDNFAAGVQTAEGVSDPQTALTGEVDGGSI
jgi:hypothetical protein